MTAPARAWLVDLDGTLYRPGPLKRRMAFELLFGGWSALRFVRAFRREHERLRDEGAEADDPFALQLERAAARVGVSRERGAELVDEWMVRRPCRRLRSYRREPLVARLDAHRAAGGLLALVSDYPAAAKLAALELADRFSVVVSPGSPLRPRRLKPAPDGYLLAARTLGVEPATCLVLGDRDDADGAAARAAGMAFELIG